MDGKVKEWLGADNLLAKRISARIVRERELRVRGRADARLQIHYPDVNDREAIHRVLSHYRVNTFYLIHNKYWSGRFNDLLKVMMQDSRVQFQGTRTFKGIDVLKFRVLS
jgi:hypothetical protein